MATTGSAQSVTFNEPPSLSRRGPAKVEITDPSGRSPRMVRGFVHVRAGRKIRIKIVPQTPTPGCQPAKAEIKAAPSLRPEDGPRQIKEGLVEACQADYVARFTSSWPLPRRAEVCASVSEEGKEPCKILIVIAIWPSLLAVLMWVMTSVIVVMFSARFLDQVRTVAPVEALRQIASNLSFIYEAAAIGFGLTLLVHLVGVLAVWLGIMAGDGE